MSEANRFKRPEIVRINGQFQRRVWNQKAQEYNYTDVEATDKDCATCGDAKEHHRGGLGLCMFCSCNQYRKIKTLS